VGIYLVWWVENDENNEKFIVFPNGVWSLTTKNIGVKLPVNQK
jgi:hypothetical protein